jgi:flagellar hook-basal body complex protein FliE
MIPPVGALVSELGLTQSASLPKTAAGSAAEALPAGGAEAPSGGPSGTFSSTLSGAITSLEGTQQSADSASQALATGTAKDPESAVVTVEEAQMAMDLAAQIRTKATEAVQSIFQTQA